MIDFRLPIKLRSAYLSMHRATNAILTELDITADQYVILLHLHENGIIIQRELVEKANSDPNTVRAMLLILEKKELVLRKKSKTDSRARDVELTPKGISLFSEAQSKLKELNTRLYDQFQKEEALMLGNLLDRFNDIMK